MRSSPDRSGTARRHWRELAERACTDEAPFAAAALYPYAAPRERAGLEARMFGERRDRLLLASAPFVAPAVLARLAALDDGGAVQLRLARNPATSAAALGALWRADASPRLRQLIARHARTPRAVLGQIAAAAGEIETLRALCENGGVAAEVLATVSERRIGVLQRLLAVNIATAEDTLLALWAEADDEAVRAQILLHPHCPDVLLATVPASLLERRCLARQQRAPRALLAELANDRDAAVRRAAAENPGTPLAALVANCFDADATVRHAVAARRDLPPALAGCLVDDADARVRRALARNPACPPELLVRPATDADAEVRRAAARHPHCPHELLDRLSRDEVTWVQAAVAYRDELPYAVLRRLARSSDVDVLAGVARHPATAPSRLARLAIHDCPDVRRAVILNPRTPRMVLRLLRQDGYALHRAMAVDHPRFADTDRWRMRDDPDVQVRFRVFQHFARRDAMPAAHEASVHVTQLSHYQPHPPKEHMETT
ncbi:hypothetical protein GPA22_03905 [Aromatoleum toluvorans]|uniref:Leucine rich repeat variant n=1 Tax=Aromatoleum toluvorans TaxID=92002 RepID=A0ABX1PUK3_9RHOO|nr:hypothetical protein [Aromatoleum toluvorans]NMG42880.1 hypothetical protein [Aromatoleum toluvorans]